MNSRGSVVRGSVVAVLVLVCLVGAAGVVAADHDNPDEDAEIIEVQNVTLEGTDLGQARVEMSYHVTDEVGGFDVTIFEPGVEVTNLDGFTQIDSSKFQWDESTENPSITVTRQTNLSVSPFEGLDFVETSDWALQGSISTRVGFRAEDVDAIDRSVYVTSDDPNTVEGRRMVYFGDYDRRSFESEGEQFQLIDTTDGEAWWSTDEIETMLVESSEMFDVGGDDDPVTGIVVDDPLRRGGFSSGRASDFWIHQKTLTPGHTTLWHEYVHTRQVDELDDDAVWTHEGEAEFYGFLLALKQGAIDYHEMYDHFATVDDEYDDAVLAEPDTWQGTRANYQLGGLTIAALDARIRDATGGERTYEDVLASKNGFGDNISADRLRSFVRDAGAGPDPFFDRYVASETDGLDLPPPTYYRIPPDDGALAVTGSDSTVEPGDTTVLEYEVTNSGSTTSLAPAISVDLPDGFAREKLDLDTDRGIESRLSVPGDVVVFDNLEPGETVILEYVVSVDPGADFQTHDIEATVTDLANNGVVVRNEIAVTPTPEASLDGPNVSRVGAEITFDASGSTADTGIAGYQWSVVGPDGEQVVQAAGETLTRSFEQPGRHSITVTVENDAGGTDSAERILLVTDTPRVTIDAPTNAAVGETIVLNATVTNEVGDHEIRWDIGDEQLAGDRIELTVRSEGVYDVNVTVTDEYGASSTERVTITVGDPDTATGGSDANGPLDAVGPGFGVATVGVAILVSVALARTRD